MRNCLGVWIAGAALCAMSWAQASAPAAPPAPAPPSSSSSSSSSSSTQEATLPSAPTAQESSSNPPIPPRPMPKSRTLKCSAATLTRQMGPLNAGHWADLDGYNCRRGCERGRLAGPHCGRQRILRHFENSHYRASSLSQLRQSREFRSARPARCSKSILASTTCCLAPCFPTANTSAGFPSANSCMAMEARAARPSPTVIHEVEISSGRALLAGGGADHVISERFAVRFKADYLQTATSFAMLGKKSG